MSLPFSRAPITITVPYPTLHSVNFDPDKTVTSAIRKEADLLFDSINMDAEQTKKFEAEAESKLSDRLYQDDCLDIAARYAILSATELYQPIIERISPV